jgi:hypothetical protein
MKLAANIRTVTLAAAVIGLAAFGATVAPAFSAGAAVAAGSVSRQASPNLLTQTNLIYGSEIGAWETNGGPAVTSPTVAGEVTAADIPMIRYAVYDCFSTERCGRDNHTGSLSKATYESAITGIVNTDHAIPWLKMVPITSGSIGSVTNGSIFCPALNDLSMNLAMEKQLLAATAAVYKGPIVIESSNEAEYDCASYWGYSSAGSSGVSTDIGEMYAATMPSLVEYARSLGFSDVVTVGYIGVNGGPGWGDACTASSGYPYGYNCNPPDQWIDQFNQAVQAAYAAHRDNPDYIPNVESVHSYCHSTDFATNPFTFDDNECYAFQREWLTNSRSQVNGIWGSAIGNNIRFAVSEWQAGACDSYPSDCWSGYNATGDPVGSYINGYLSMLAGNGVTTGTGTAYWGANLFEIASNGTGTEGPGAYNVINADGTVPTWYADFQSDSVNGQGG